MMDLEEGTRFQVLAPVVRGRKGEYAELFRELQTKGFARARVDGTVVRLEEPPTLKKYEKHDIEVIVDRLSVKESARRRLNDSVETALQLSGGTITLEFVDLPEDDPNRERFYSEHLYCPYDDLSFEEMEPRSFSFNSPFGACPECTGLGTKMEVDPDLVVPDPERALGDGAIHPWSGGHTSEYFTRLIEALGHAMGFGLDTPWERLPKKAQKSLLYGHEEQIHVRYSNRFGRQRAYYTTYDGVIPWVQRRHAEAESDAARERFEGYMREIPCPACKGGQAQAGQSVGHGRREVDRRGLVDVDRRVRQVPRRAQAVRPRHADRRAGGQGDQRPHGLPARRRPRLPHDGPRRRHPRRWRGAAHQARHADRLWPGRRALRAGRAVHRPAPARQHAAARHPDQAARHGQHADRGRA
ncbi:hypothetical protein GCM10020001_008790 [Nonomuraea salmonea]